MKVCNSEIGERGLGRLIVENDLADMTIILNGRTVKCSRNILIIGNSTLAKEIRDEKFNDILRLYEGCNLEAFLEVERYYGGGFMNIDVDNVCEILKFSVYYNDDKIYKICYKYIKNHLDKKLLVEIFNITHLINFRKCDLYEISKSTIMSNVFDFIKDDNCFYSLTFNSLCILLNSQQLIIKNETWLLERLIIWNNKYQQKLEATMIKNEEEEKVQRDDDFVYSLEKFIDLIYKKVNLNEVNWECIKSKYSGSLQELMLDDYSGSRNHLCINFEDLDQKLLNIIQKYYYDESIYTIENNDLNDLYLIDVSKIEKLLFEEDIKIIKIALLIIIDTKSAIKIDVTTKYQLTARLCLDYNNNNQLLRTVKCLTYFTNEKEFIYYIYNLCVNNEIVYKILHFYDILSKESREFLIDFLKQNGKIKEELINKYILKDVIIDEIQNKITKFSYLSPSYSFIIGETISIKPECDSQKCEFTITPNLPECMNINNETGEIYGDITTEMNDTEFLVKCSNLWNEKYFKLSIELKNVVFIDNKYSDKDLEEIKYAEITKDGKAIEQKSDEVYSRRWLNIKMNEGVYQIKYLFNCKSKKNKLLVGISNCGVCYGDVLYIKSNKCCYCNDRCDDKNVAGSLCDIVDENPNIFNHGDGSIYELIIDMQNKQFWIKHNNAQPILIAKDFSPPIYTFVSLYYVDTSVTLISVIHKTKITEIK